MKCFIYCVLVTLITSINVYSQTNISGKLIDKETRQPIELVTVATSDAYTATNELGEFEIKTASDFLVFSHMGYNQLKIRTQLLPSIIELQSKIIIANEVVVKPDYAIKQLKQVQKKYYDIIKKYSPKFPETTFYYRQQSENGNSNTQFIECFFSGKNGVAIHDLTLQNGRYAQIKSGDSIPTFNITNAFIFSLFPPVSTKGVNKSSDLILPLSQDFTKYYDIDLSYTVDPNSPNEIKVYKFTPNTWSQNECPNPIAGGLLHVRTKDNFILRFQEESTKQSALKLDKHSQNKSKILDYIEQIDFIYSDKYHIPTVQSVKVKLNIKVKGIVKGKEEVIDFSIKTIMFATDDNIKKTGSQVKNNDKLLRKVARTKYDHVFWENNPIIKRTPIENQIIEDFTKLGYFGNFEIE